MKKSFRKILGTLWEKTESTNSCNHSFTSAVIYWLKGMENV